MPDFVSLSRFPAVSVLLLSAACAAPQGGLEYSSSPNSETVGKLSPGDLEGIWEGIYMMAVPVSLRLDLRADADGALRGEAHVRSLQEVRAPFRVPEGRYRVSGSYDVLSRSFELTPGDWIGEPDRSLDRRGINGVYDAVAPALAGTVAWGRTQEQPFVATRPDVAEEALRRPVQDAMVRVSGGAGTGLEGLLLRGVTDVPGDEELEAWASRMTVLYPNPESRQGSWSHFHERALPLFGDAHFSPHFGVPFDRLGRRARGYVSARFSGTYIPLGERSAGWPLQRYSAFGDAFSGGRTTAWITTGLLANRVLRSWAQAVSRRLESDEDPRAVFARLRLVDEAAERHLRYMDPDESGSIKTAFYSAAANSLQSAVRAGNARAHFLLGGLHLLGLGVPRDASRAVELYEVAVDAGIPAAFASLGLLYDAGRGVPRDPGRAVSLYARGAERGDVEAIAQMGYAHLRGTGLPRDAAEAYRWLTRASSRGHERAALDVAMLQARGEGTSRDLNSALNVLRRLEGRAEDYTVRQAASEYRERVERQIREERAELVQNVVLTGLAVIGILAVFSDGDAVGADLGAVDRCAGYNPNYWDGCDNHYYQKMAHDALMDLAGTW